MELQASSLCSQCAGVLCFWSELCLGHACRSLIVSGNRGLRRPHLRSQTLESLSFSSCCNLERLNLSCAQLRRLQAWLCSNCRWDQQSRIFLLFCASS